MRNHLAFGLLLLGLAGPTGGESLRPEEIVAGHLAAVGPAEVLDKAKARVIEGSCRLHLLIGGKGTLDGQARLLSDGQDFRVTLGFDALDYRGETISFSRGKVDIGFMQPGRRSDLGNFLSSYHAVVREGLLGGVLSTAWPLLDLTGRKPKLKDGGLKKVEGQKWLVLRYRMDRGQGDMNIDLFFEPETYRHRRTVYSLALPAQMGPTITESSRQRETGFHLEENFGDFQVFEGLTLPTTWTLTFSHEFRERSSLWKWETRIQRVRAPGSAEDRVAEAQSTRPRPEAAAKASTGLRLAAKSRTRLQARKPTPASALVTPPSSFRR